MNCLRTFWKVGRGLANCTVFAWALIYSCLLEASQEPIHNVIDCQIFDMKGEILRRYPGEFCIFLDDGRFVSAQKSELLLYDQSGKVIWRRALFPHHQMNLSLDGKRILVLGSETRSLSKDKKDLFRSDVYYIVDLSGKILNEYRLFDHAQAFPKERWANAKARRFPLIWSKATYPGVSWEFSHTNSFYEIPENILGSRHSAFKKGNFIFNDISLMITFVLNADLKSVLWQSPILREDWTMLHDVQVLQGTDRLLIYDNGTPNRRYSRLLQMNPISEKIYWEYKAKPSTSFYMEKRGGVQLLPNGHTLYNDFNEAPRGIELDKSGNQVWKLVPQQFSGAKGPFQQIKRYDLSSFLEKNKGL